jgi:hypothetical protein
MPAPGAAPLAHADALAAVDLCVRSLPTLGALRFGPWPSCRSTWCPRAWTPGPNLVLADPWLSRLVGRAAAVRAGADVGCDGPCEWLTIESREGEQLMRCELLPQSDFCAWETLLAQLGIGSQPAPQGQGWLARLSDDAPIRRQARPCGERWLGRVLVEPAGRALRLECRPLDGSPQNPQTSGTTNRLTAMIRRVSGPPTRVKSPKR